MSQQEIGQEVCIEVSVSGCGEDRRLPRASAQTPFITQHFFALCLYNFIEHVVLHYTQEIICTFFVTYSSMCIHLFCRQRIHAICDPPTTFAWIYEMKRRVSADEAAALSPQLTKHCARQRIITNLRNKNPRLPSLASPSICVPYLQAS